MVIIPMLHFTQTTEKQYSHSQLKELYSIF